MLIGIIASTQTEANLITTHLKKKKEFCFQSKYFYTGILSQNTRVVVCICGIGKANAAHGTALLIEKFKINVVYVIGIGGAYPSAELKIGDIAIAEKEIYGDDGLIAGVTSQRSGVREKKRTNFYTMDRLHLPLATINRINYYNEFSMFIPQKFKIQDSKFKVKIGNFITVSTCTGTLRKGKELEKRFNAICENMEGAAVAHICALSNIHVTEIRSISNIIKDRKAKPLNKKDISKSAENAQRFLLDHI